MESKLITCPDTAHLEQIEFERTRRGIVIARCSRFTPSDCVNCGGECARRMDIRDHKNDESRSKRVLVAYGHASRTEPIARALRSLLSQDGLVVELADADRSGTLPAPNDYDAVVIGISRRLWRHPPSIVRYLAQHREALADLPGFLFVVGRVVASDVGSLAERTGWLPKRTARFTRPPRLARWFGDLNRVATCDTDALRSFALQIGEDVPEDKSDAMSVQNQ